VIRKTLLRIKRKCRKAKENIERGTFENVGTWCNLMDLRINYSRKSIGRFDSGNYQLKNG